MKKLFEFAIVLGLFLGHVALGQEIEFHFIYVGQGDCILVKCPNGRNILVDCGSTKDGDESAVREYIRSEIGPAGKINVLVVSHPDGDHYSMIPSVLSGVQVDKVLHVGSRSEHPASNFSSWLDSHPNRQSLGSSDTTPENSPSDLFGTGDTKFYILSANTGSSKNARSIVLLVSFKDFDVLLTGDATEETEEDILERYDSAFLDVELLKVGHHGANGSSTDDFLEAIHPETAIVSAAYWSQFQHPRKEALDRIALFTESTDAHQIRWGIESDSSTFLVNRFDYTEAIYSTAVDRNIEVTSDGTTYSLTFDSQPTPPLFAFNTAARGAAVTPSAQPAPGVVRRAAPATGTAAELPFPVGANVSITTAAGTVEGVFEGIDASGWISVKEVGSDTTTMIRSDNMILRAVTAGIPPAGVDVAAPPAPTVIAPRREPIRQFPERRPGAELAQVRPLIRAEDASGRFQVRGDGLAVAVFDTGLRTSHIDFAGRVIDQVNFTEDNDGSHDDATDGDGHGTNVAGIIAANGDHVGIAPGANVIPIKVLPNEGSGSFAMVRDGLQWVLDHRQEHNISVVNMSLGDSGNYTSDNFVGDQVRALIQQLRDARVAVVVAAGNDFFTHGSNQGMAFPGIIRETVSVGAVFDANEGGFTYHSGASCSSSAADQVTPFSQRLHSSVNAALQTDIFAPGAPVTSSGILTDRGESIQHGTSQASPVTSGVILLMQQFHLREQGELPTVDQIETWLRRGAVSITDDAGPADNVVNTNLDFLRIDAVGAIEAIQNQLERDRLDHGE